MLAKKLTPHYYFKISSQIIKVSIFFYYHYNISQTNTLFLFIYLNIYLFNPLWVRGFLFSLKSAKVYESDDSHV